jgi:hypothetical protein
MVLGVIDYGMLGWWVIWFIGFVAMTLAGGKGDRLNPLGLFANAIFAPLVITIMIGIFSLPLILLSLLFGDVLGFLVPGIRDPRNAV